MELLSQVRTMTKVDIAILFLNLIVIFKKKIGNLTLTEHTLVV